MHPNSNEIICARCRQPTRLYAKNMCRPCYRKTNYHQTKQRNMEMNPRAEYAANELRQALEHYYTLINHLANATDYLKTLAGEHAATTTIQNTIRNLDPIRSTINATQHHIQTKYNHTHTEEKQPQ